MSNLHSNRKRENISKRRDWRKTKRNCSVYTYLPTQRSLEKTKNRDKFKLIGWFLVKWLKVWVEVHEQTPLHLETCSQKTQACKVQKNYRIHIFIRQRLRHKQSRQTETLEGPFLQIEIASPVVGAFSLSLSHTDQRLDRCIRTNGKDIILACPYAYIYHWHKISFKKHKKGFDRSSFGL